MASALFTPLKKKLLDGSNINFASDTIKVALLTSSWTPNNDTNQFFSDINANEIVGTGYVAGGLTLGNKTVTQDNTNHLATFSADAAQWPTSTFAAVRYAAIYKYTGVNSTSPLIGYLDFTTDKSSSADTFYISWDTNGIMRIT